MIRSIVLLSWVLFPPSLIAADLSLPFVVDSRFRSILVTGTVNGHPATLLVDTGASSTFVTGEMAGVSPVLIERARFRGDTGLVVHHVKRKARMGLGPQWHCSIIVGAANLADVSKRYGRRIDGILGQDVLRQFTRVTIDFEARTLVLSP